MSRVFQPGRGDYTGRHGHPPTGGSPTRAATRPRRAFATLTAMSLLAAGVSLPILTLAAPAKAAVSGGSNISAFPYRRMACAVGYEVGEHPPVEWVRKATVIVTSQRPAIETPKGVGLELNPGPEGTPAPGDCWPN